LSIIVVPVNTAKMAYIMFVYETDEGSWSSGMILS